MNKSHVGDALKHLLEEEQLSQRAFAVKCEVDQATVHHAMNGRPLSRENLAVFCRQISANPAKRFVLLAAHLLDEAAAAKDSINIQSLVIRMADDTSLAELKLDPALSRDVTVIAGEAVDHKDVRDILSGMAANILRYRHHGSAPTAAAKKKKPKAIDIGHQLTPLPRKNQERETG